MTGADDELLWRVFEAQTTNAELVGTELREIAQVVAQLCVQTGGLLLAADGTGERLIGAALVLHPDLCRAVDTTRRIDDQAVLLVSGRVAGPFALAEVAARVHCLGGADVSAAVVGGWSGEIAGVSQIHRLPQGPSRSADPDTIRLPDRVSHAA